MFLIIIILYFIFFNQLEYFDIFKSQPSYFKQYHLIQPTIRSNILFHFLVFGEFKYIPIERYFPLKKIIQNGSLDILLQVFKNKNNIGLIQEDIIYGLQNIQYNKTFYSIYRKNINTIKLQNINVICKLYRQLYNLLIKATHKDINHYKDIYHKPIGVMGSGSLYSLYNIYNYYGWEWDDKYIKYYNNEYRIYQDFKNEHIYGIFIVTEHPSSFIKNIYNYISIKFIDINTIDINKIRYFLPYIKKTSIPIDYYYQTNYSLETFYTNTFIICNRVIDTHKIYLFTKYIYQNFGFYSNYTQLFNNIYKYDIMIDNKLIDTHMGSIKLYQELGLIKYKELINGI